MDDVQLVQVLQSVQHLAQYLLHPLEKKQEAPAWGGACH